MNLVENFLHQKEHISPYKKASCFYGSSVLDFIRSIGLSLIISIEDRFASFKNFRQQASISAFKEHLYPILQKQIELVKEGIKSNRPDEVKEAVNLYKELLLLDAEIKVSSASRFLRDKDKLIVHKKEKHSQSYLGDQSYNSEELKVFRDQLKELKQQIPEIDDAELKRWIDSRSLQRKMAAISKSKMLPFKAKDVPAGAILLTNKEIWYKSLRLEYENRFFKQYFLFSIIKIYKIFSGKGIPHAEISLGDGKFLHQWIITKLSKQDIESRRLQNIKKPGQCILITNIEDRTISRKKDKILPHDILMPNRVDAQWETIIQDVQEKAETYNVITDIDAITRCAYTRFFPSRKPDYELRSPLVGHQYDKPLETMTLSCSAFIASIFALHKIDIGKEFNKKPEEVSPADFDNSSLFRKIYTAG